ncbi:IPT/TIG domain-containing protein [Candidatus Saccharibacteria bacterium]|nr:IPT/TIG domain-containing protein [Candidatus Saccharibacteria bacterium]
MINPTETATALSITSITPNIGSIDGGELVTITGDFGIPTDVPLNIVEISAGTNHTLALDSNGQIWAWGANGNGQLGNGTNTASSVPVEVDMTGVLYSRDIIQIVGGAPHTLALDSEGQIFAWGLNTSGQLGDGTNTNSNIPVAVDITGALAGRRVVQIAASHHASLALDSEGRVFSFGGNWSGQLGDDTNINSNIPVEVDMTGVLAGRRVVQIASGNEHYLALDSEGQIFAWGLNTSGQLGNGTFTNSSVPVEVDMTGVLAGRDIVQISTSTSHSLALDSEGRIFTWGNGGSGQLGNGTNTASSVPVEVDMTGVLAGRRVVQIAAGGDHTLALDSSGQIWTWGGNANGQLGDGTNTASNVPVEVDMTGVLAGRDIVQMTTGNSYSLALDSEGRVFAWGAGGAFGNGTNTGSNVPIAITNFGQGLIDSLDLSVTMGGSPCTNVRVVNPTTITCITPAHPAGVVDVTVRTLHGSVTLYQSYTFIDLPDVPNTGHERL